MEAELYEGKTVNFEVLHFPRARVIGKSVQVKVETTLDDSTITDLLEKMSSNGDYDYLLCQPETLSPYRDTVGWQGDYNFGDAVRDTIGYQYDDSHGLFEMEYYSQERFYNRKNKGEKVIMDFYSPCKKAVNKNSIC